MSGKAFVKGLRTSDSVTLQVLTPDLLRKPIHKLQAQCLCDLMALSELEDLPVQLSRDLVEFQHEMVREFNDLPTGQVLGEFLQELTDVDADNVPACLRAAITARSDDAMSSPKSAGHYGTLVAGFEGKAPETLHPASQMSTVKVQKHETPNSHKHPDERTPRKKAAAKDADDKPKKKKLPSPRLPAKAMRDPERGVWIREYVVERLSNYGTNGLKQNVLVAGCQRLSPYSDLSPSEVIAVLKTLKNEGKVKLSVGRWARPSRW
ncbi:MAG: hypothetical protein GY913_25320 [Proteobacteria bacterium]|nr:hypothetical protein [Pseudomonadota bacterium]MCP4920234.1 hypothetical protein [Pseudomonadota bacterium]